MNRSDSSHSADPIQDLLGHADFVRALARRLVSSDSDADDVVQDVWVRSLDRPPATSTSLRGWLAQVTYNLVTDRRRHSTARKGREALARGRSDAEPSAASSNAVAARLALVDQLGRALAALPNHYRQVIYLRYYEDLSPERIARQLGRPLATIKTQLRRGLELLRSDMERRSGGSERLSALLLPLCAGIGLTRNAATSSVALPIGASLMKKTVVVIASIAAFLGSYAYLERGDEAVRIASSIAPRVDLAPVAPTGGELPVGALREPERRSDALLMRAPLPVDSKTSAVFGTVRYASTGQGVPFYRFMAAAGPQREWITTDAHGQFRSIASFPATFTAHLNHWPATGSAPSTPIDRAGSSGASSNPPRTPTEPLSAASETELIDLEFIDFDGSSEWPRDFAGIELHAPELREQVIEEREVNRSDLGQACELQVTLGPTFFLDVRFPANYAADDFQASYAPEVTEHRTREARRAALSGEDPHWVRFPYDPTVSTTSPRWAVGVEAADGLWAGSADAPFVLGVCEATLRIALQPYATLSGTVRTEDGSVPAQLWVQLQCDDQNEHRMESSGSTGHYQFRLLRDGNYSLFVKDTDYFPFETALRLHMGQPHTADIRLQARQPGGSLSGRITSATGQFHERVILFLEGLDDQDVWRRADPEWTQEGERYVADYSFDELGNGSYTLSCCTIEAVSIEARVRTLSPPNDAVSFHIDDDRPLSDLEFRVVDHRTGEPLDAYQVHFQQVGNVELLDAGTSADPWSKRVSRDVRFTWRVFAPGYESASGDQSAFSSQAPLEVRMSAGFSAIVNLNSIESMRSLSGVEIFADGVSVGWSDEDGFVYVNLDERPDRITLDPTLWTVFTNDTFVSDFDVENGFADWNEREVYLSAYLRPVR